MNTAAALSDRERPEAQALSMQRKAGALLHEIADELSSCARHQQVPSIESVVDRLRLAHAALDQAQRILDGGPVNDNCR